MDNLGQLRVYVSKKYFPIFHEMTKSKLFSQNSEFFIFCTFVGQIHNIKKALEKKHELCRAVTLNEYDRVALEALYLKENGKLLTFKETIQLAEEYANGGIEYILGGFLSEFTIEDEEGNWRLKPGVKERVQMSLFDYLLNQKDTVPF